MRTNTDLDLLRIVAACVLTPLVRDAAARADMRGLPTRRHV